MSWSLRAVVMFVVTTGVAGAASAGLDVCNDSPFRLYVAVGFHESGVWKSKGWYHIDAGHCGLVIGADLDNRYYYVHAHDSTGEQRWGRDVTFCTQSSAFTIAGDNCSVRGFDVAKFSKVDTGGSKHFRWNLACDTCLSRSGWRLTAGLPRLTHSFSIAGRPVGISLAGKLDVDFSGSTLKANAVVFSDLSDFQGEAGNIIRAQVNHNDDCDYVLNMHTVSLAPAGNALHVYAAGHYEDWECPVVDLGLLGEIDGGKHRLFEQNGSVSSRLRPGTNGRDVWISVEITGLAADGVLGNFLDSDWFGPYIRSLIVGFIPELVHVGNVRDLLPAALRSFPLRLTDVSFYDRGNGKLGIRVAASMTVDADSAASVWARLQ